VVAGQSFQITSSTNGTGQSVIRSADGTDVSAEITGGSIGGLLKAHNLELPAIGAQLDALAVAFTTQLNSVHRNGFDLDGNAGGDLFVAAGSTKGAASEMQVAITNPRMIAGSTDKSNGDNSNLLALLGVADTKLLGGSTPIQAYAAIVYSLGSSIQGAKQDSETSGLMLQQMGKQRSAISGVSLDEEAANLIRFQRAYQAAARVVSVTNELMDTVINLGRY
jgi:flagellar hook-associated protein 1 FlgK